MRQVLEVWNHINIQAIAFHFTDWLSTTKMFRIKYEPQYEVFSSNHNGNRTRNSNYLFKEYLEVLYYDAVNVNLY